MAKIRHLERASLGIGLETGTVMYHRPDVGVGVSFVLSVLVVGVAAVALHPVSEAKDKSSASTIAPAPTERSRPKANAGRSAVARGPRAVPVPSSPDSSLAQTRSAPAARPATTTRTSFRRPDSAFTHAAPGETLTDVAVRVYGSAEAGKTLWKANRDRVENADVPLVAGMMVRTP